MLSKAPYVFGLDSSLNLAAGFNLETALKTIHARYAQLEYLLLAFFVLYCLGLMQFIAKKSSGKWLNSVRALFAALIGHLAVTGIAAGTLYAFPQAPVSTALGNCIKQYFKSYQMVFMIPLVCIGVMFVPALFAGLLRAGKSPKPESDQACSKTKRIQ